MASKPNIADSRWGTTAGDVDASNVTAPTSGQRDTGYVLNSVPSSAVDNYLRNRAYRWFQYVSDGALSGDHSINGALTVGGQPLTFSSTFTANPATSVFTTPAAHGRSTGDGPFRTSVSGGALAAGLVAGTDYWWITLSSTTYQLATSFANAVAGAPLTITTAGTGTQTIASTGATTHATDATVSRGLTVGGVVTANGGVTIGANQHVTVSGTGKLRRGARTRHVSAFSFVGSTPPNYSATAGFVAAGSATYRSALVLEEGEQLQSVVVLFNGFTGATTTMVVNKQTYNIGGAQPSVVQLGSTATSGTQTGGIVGSIAVSGLTETAGAAAVSYWAEITQSATGGTAIIGLDYVTVVP